MEGIINGTREVFKSAMIISTGVLIIIMFGFALVAIGPEFVTIERDTAPEALVAAVPESLNAGARARASEDLLRVPPDLLAEFLPDYSTEDTIINNSWTNVMWTSHSGRRRDMCRLWAPMALNNAANSTQVPQELKDTPINVRS